MDKLAILLILLAANQICSGQISLCKNELEQKGDKFYYEGNLYTGLYKCFNESGIIREKGYILNGQLDSIAEFYSTQGDTTELQWYNEGQLEKRRIFTYNPTGKIVTTLDSNDKLHGLSVKYYPDGNKKERQLFCHGESIGKWFTWDKQGRIIVATDFTGEVIIRKIHDYKWGRHKVLIQHFDKKTNKVVFKKVEKN